MSNHLPPPPSGDQYLYTSQNGFNYGIPGLDGSVLSYQTLQPQGLRDEAGPSTQNTLSMNTYAFDTNRNAIHRDGGEPRLQTSQVSFPSSVQPAMPSHIPDSLSASRALPGLPNVASAQTNGVNLQATHDDISSAVAFKGVDTRNVEQVGSDLEEGELSEGTDRASPNVHTPSRPLLHSQSSMRVDGTSMRETVDMPRKDFPRTASKSERAAQDHSIHRRSPALGIQNNENRQRKYGTMRASRQAVNGHATKMDWAGRDRTPPSQRHRVGSLQVSREAARHAIKQLQLHNIDYSQLLKEHIDSELLRTVYAELQLTVPEPSSIHTSLVDTEVQKESIIAPAESKNKTNFSPNITNQTPDARVITVDPVPQHVAKTQDWQQKTSQSHQEAKAEAEAASKGINQEPSVGNHSGHNKNSIIDPDKVVTAKSTPSRIESNADQVAKPSSALPSDKSTPAMSIPEQSPQPPAPATTNTNKSPASKPAPKPVDRKEYIARLLAAKAGKTLPMTNAAKPPSDPVPHEVPPAPSEATKYEAPGIEKSDLGPISSNFTLKKVEEPTGTAVNSAAQKSTAAEAKKREQTELARRKIEELKKRSEALKKTPPAAREATHQSPTVQNLITAPSEQMIAESTRLPTLHNTSQNSYFPLHNATFTIPGLFMTSQRSQPDQQRGPATAAPMPENATQTDLFIPTTSSNSNTDMLPQQSVLTTKTPASPEKEQNLAENRSITQVTISKPVSNTRKRPTAADFLEPVPSKSRRLGNAKPDDSVVFEVSDDEVDEPDQITTETQLNGDSEIVSDPVGGLQTPRSGSHEQNNHSQQPALTGSLGVSETNNITVTLPLQSLLAQPKLKESGGLRSKEKEIARMNRKIAEMEERRKSKQAASRVPTPGTPSNTTSSIKLADDNVNVASMSSSIRRFSEPSTQMEEGKRMLEDVQTLESTLQNDSLIKHRMQSIERTEKDADSAITIIDEQQRRKAEIESRIPSMNATVEEFMAKLQRLQKEEADLQAQIQKQIDDKLSLQSELDKILQASAPVAESAVKSNADIVDPKINAAVQVPVPSVPLSPGKEQHLVDSPDAGKTETSLNGDSPEDDTCPLQLSAPETPMSTETPTDQSLVDGELAEDVMDISGSDDEDVATEDRPGSGANESPLVEESDSEEMYEPPASFEVFEKDPATPPDSKQILPNDGESSHQELRTFEPSSPSVKSGREIDVQDAVEHGASSTKVPDASDRASSIVEISDSDDYEPPEPTASVDVPSPAHDLPAFTSDSSFSPPDANHVMTTEPASPDPLIKENDQAAMGVVEMATSDPEKTQIYDPVHGYGYFTPYESPLQQFHAYRYHPDFVSRVGNGYRSLTYSHKIDALKPLCPYDIGGRCNDPACDNQHFKSMNLSDDLILVQMGAVPESLSPEQKEAFVVGLRQIIQEIRGKKVKDFRTVASEIAAYRVRFLGDNSGILPL